MNGREKKGHGGRPRTGRDDSFSVRTTLELGERIAEGANTLETSLQKYVELILCRAHDYSPPNKVECPAAFEKTISADRQREHLGHSTTADAREVTDHLHASCARSGLNANLFGPALGVAAPVMEAFMSGHLSIPARVLVAAERISRGLAAAREHQFITPVVATSGKLGRFSDDHATLALFKHCRDDLRRARTLPDVTVLGAWEASPPTTGRIELDVLLAAFIRHEFKDAASGAPAWTRRPDLKMVRPWHLPIPGLTLRELEARTPQWLREAKLFVAATDLGSKTSSGADQATPGGSR